MSTQVQFRRGNTTQTNAFTGAVSEITVDTDKKVVVVHDGVTAGGWPAPTLAFVQAAFDKANTTDISEAASFVTANAAFDQANSGFTQANSAFSKANNAYEFSYSLNTSYNNLYATTNVVSSQANTAANNAAIADSKAVTAGSYANSAYTQANTATTNAATADSKAVTSGSYANSAYSQANTATTNAATADSKAVTAGSYANSAFGHSNATSIRAESAFVQANASFTAANIGKTFVENGGTINGSVTIAQDLSVTGNITFGGNSTSISSNNLSLSDSLIYLADNNSGNTVDIGIVGSFTQGVYQHTAMFRDHLDGRWKFVSNVISEPVTTVDSANGEFDIIMSGGIETTGYANIGTVLYVGTNQGTPLGGAINPVIAGVGNSTSYIQNYVFNTANGSGSSADIAVYPNNGSDVSGWLDMGITSNNFTEASFNVTGRNEGYLFMSAPDESGTSGNLVIATDSTGTYNSIELYVNGFDQGKSNPVMVFENTRLKTNRPLSFSDNTSQNTAAAPYGYSNAAFLQANSAYNNSNTKVSLSGDTMSGNLTLPTLYANTAVTINSVGTIIATTLTTTSNTQVVLDSFSNTAIRSARYQIQLENENSFHSTEIGLLHNGANSYITQYAELKTNGPLGTFETTIASGTVNLLFTPANTTNTVVNAIRTSMPYTDTTPVGGGGGGTTYSGSYTTDFTSGALMLAWGQLNSPIYVDTSRFSNTTLRDAILAMPIGTVVTFSINQATEGNPYTFTSTALYNGGTSEIAGTSNAPVTSAPSILEISFTY